MASRAGVLVLTPGALGADGVSALSRSIAAALGARPPAGTLEAPGPVEVLSLADPPGAPGQDGWTLVGCAGSRARFASRALAAALAAPPRVVCVHLHLAPAALPLMARGARVTVVLCGIEAWKPLRPLEGWAMRRAAQRLAISAHTARRFRETHPALAGLPIEVCHPGASPEAPDPGPSTQTGPFALMVGRMDSRERYKGHDRVLEEWPIVLGAEPRATLLVVGDGDDRPRLEAKAAALGLAGSVRFTGRVDDRTLAALYRDCRFFLMPSRDEGFGYVFLEAMRAGRACIAAPGAAEEIIADGVSGLVVDPADPGQIRSAVIRLFRDAATAESLGVAARRRFLESFTENQFRRRFRRALGLEEADPACAG